MFNLILDGMNGFSAKIGSTVPLGRGYFPHDPRHFVPGYDRAVPPGQNTLDRGPKTWLCPSFTHQLGVELTVQLKL
jgi:hypothetical protein